MQDIAAPEEDGASIVLIGAFNPRIFHPAWFVRNELLPEGEEEAANVEAIGNDISIFETEWFRIEVLSDRFILRTMSTPAVEALRDLILGTFRILRHTPVKKIGLNSHAHFRLANEQQWNDFGHTMAPKEDLWDPILAKPGTLSLSIQGERDGDHAGQVRVKVEPSYLITHGIFIETNDEYSRLDADSAGWIEEILTSEWEPSRRQSERIRSHIVSQALGRRNEGKG